MAQAEQLRRVLRRQPFRAFRLRMVDGREYVVPHPDWLSVPPGPRPREAVYYAMPEGGAAVEEYEVHWLDLALIGEVIEAVVPAATPPASESAL
jgi:hypothetical protein